tara:strand:- start:1142 stop:1807 length:666 start_codon:yes stop_codon:yes gene_type:complete
MNEQATLNTQVLDALLLDYATGALSRPLELLVETHLAMNEKSSRSMRMLMQLGGILLEDAEPISLSEDALQNVMAQLGQFDKDTDEMFAKINEHSEWLPHPIVSYLPKSDCKQSWRRAGIGIVETDIDFGEEDGKAKIYRISSGTAVPIHTHTGAEVTLVLSGGFTDESGSYGPGDISIQEAGTEHKPIADDDGECMVLTVNEGEIKLTGPIGRVLGLLVN